MLKALAVVRSIMLLVVLYLIFFRANLWPVDPRLTCDEQRLYYFRSSQALLGAAATAATWMALEAGLTWWRALRKARRPATTAASTPSAPTAP